MKPGSLLIRLLCLFPLFIQVFFCPQQVRAFEDYRRSELLLRLDAEIDRLIKRFDHEPFIDKTPLEPVDPQWRRLGFVPFIRSPGRSIYPNTVPAQEERGASLAAFAACGETEPLLFGLRTLEDGIRELRVSVSGLVSLDTVGVIPRECLELSVVEYFRVRWGDGSAARSWRWHPVRIWPLDRYPGSPFCRPTGPGGSGSLSVAPNTAQAFRLTVHTPLDAPSGRYMGSVFFESERGAFRIPLFFHVLPVTLEREGLFAHGVFVSGPQDKTAAADLAAHGVNAVGWWYDPDLLKAGSEKGEVVFDFTLQDAFLQRLEQAGLTGPHLIYAGRPPSPLFDYTIAETMGIEPGKPEFLKLYAQAVQTIFEHARKNYGSRLIWGIFDRPDKDRHRKSLESFSARARALRSLMGPGARLVSPVVEKIKKREKEHIARYVDIWLLGQGVEEEDNFQETALKWAYTACTQRDSAAGSRY
ncbi:MAG: hypothetical protein U9N45_02685, partial [Gemmatimonadota bacterium]|nr:hypothetical protein [Gemmatimonadota bacterium]